MRRSVRLLVNVFATFLLTKPFVGVSCSRCDRTPGSGTKSPVDGRFFLTVSGNPFKYIPDEVYTVTLQGQKVTPVPSKFSGFLLVVEAEIKDPVAHSLSNSHDLGDAGTFQTFGDSLTKYSEKCPNAVTHTSTMPKSEIQVLWTAPPAGSGCVTLKATVIEHHDIWYMDGGPLSRTLCEDSEDGTDSQPLIVDPCCACDEAKYEVTFEGLWSRHTHPREFPPNEWLTRFSDVIGASHSVDYRFWDYGQHASEGLRQVAEHGATRKLETELKAESEHIRTIIKARGISYPNLNGKTFAVFRVDNRHHLISLVSMMDPSPDWIVGVSGLELCLKNCSWVESKILNLYPWDAGTDSGPTYLSADQPTTPRDVIKRIRPNFPNDPRSPFYDPSGAEMKPLARLYLSRQRLYEKTCDPSMMPSGGDEEGGEGEGNSGEGGSGGRGTCATSSWSEWSPCSVSCGRGQHLRQRFYVDEARAEAAGCSKKLTSRQKCYGQRRHCKIGEGKVYEDPNCPMTEWSDWSPCSATCGQGKQMRSRLPAERGESQMAMVRSFYKLHKRRSYREVYEANEPALEDGEEEQDNAEDGDEEVSAESDEPQPSVPDHKCKHMKLVEEVVCNSGIKCDLDEDEARNSYGEKDSSNQIGTNLLGPVDSADLTGDGTLTGVDGTTLAPYFNGHAHDEDGNAQVYDDGSGSVKNCKVSKWSQWSECSVTCGEGTRTKSRYVQRHPMNGGKPCPKLLLKEKMCHAKACKEGDEEPSGGNADQPNNEEDDEGTDASWGPVHKPDHASEQCKLSEWSSWSPCSHSCGAAAVRQRTRSILHAPPQINPIFCGPRLERKSCGLLPCPMY